MTRLVAVALLLAACALPVRAENWPQWRGPAGDGTSPEKGLPAKWSATENVAWTLKMPGMAGSTPAIWGERIFLTSEDGTDVVLMCVSTQGKELWRRKLAAGNGRKVRGDEGNNASSSPCTDGQHVWAFAGPGDFVCFDFDGKEVWRFNAQERYGRYDIQFGMHTTPALFKGRLYLSLLHSAGWIVAAIDAATGAEVWRIKRDSDAQRECEHAYTSPAVWTDGKDAYLIVHGNDYTTAHALEDGRELWRLGDLNPKGRYNPTLRFVASPTATPGLIVVPTAKSGPVVAVKPSARGRFGVGSPQEQWRKPKDTPDVPCPLVYDGLVYLCREIGGVFSCHDAATGKELYTQRTHSARYRASPVGADGKVYLTARDGTITVLKAGPTFEMLATNRLPDQTSASPAIAGGRIYVRGFQTLYALSEGGK